MTSIGVIALVVCDIVGLLLIPLGLPGLWVIVGGFLLFGWATEFRTAGLWSIVIIVPS